MSEPPRAGDSPALLSIPVAHVIERAAGVLFATSDVGVSMLVAMATAPEPCRRLLLHLTRCWPTVARMVAALIDTGLQSLEGIRAASHLPWLSIWTAIVWLLPAASTWAMLRAVHLDLPFGDALTVLGEARRSPATVES